METDSTPVLIVGGGLVGLSAAVFLSWRGVPTVLVERHPGSSPHPRAIGYTPRTMELYRAVGLGPQIPQAPPNFRLRRAKVESLAGKWFDESPWTPKDQPTPSVEYSPCNGAAIAQDRLEPILRDKAIELGADVRLNTELLRFEQMAIAVRSAKLWASIAQDVVTCGRCAVSYFGLHLKSISQGELRNSRSISRDWKPFSPRTAMAVGY